MMNALDGDLFSEIFGARLEGLREDEPDIVAIDGKTSRRSHSGDRHPLHVVFAWAARQRLVFGQQATDAKSNEITAIPLLLARLQLTGALVTIDAMGAQTKIARTILGRGADYQLALKDNHRSLADEVALFFDAPELRALCPFETVDADHGRVETRRHWVSQDVPWLNGDRRAPGELRFPGLKAIAMVEATVEQGGGTSTSRRYFISSLPLDERSLARAVRAHWGIENRLHWVLDVVFHDDQSRLRTENGPGNVADIIHMAMNPIRAAPRKDSLKVRRKAAAGDHEYRKALIARTAQ